MDENVVGPTTFSSSWGPKPHFHPDNDLVDLWHQWKSPRCDTRLSWMGHCVEKELGDVEKLRILTRYTFFVRAFYFR